jgi:hypothetical protein
MQAQVIAVEKPFVEAEQKFEKLKGRLAGSEARAMTHSALERMLEQEGRELLRLLYQAHLDVRGPGEVREKVVGADGIERNHKRLHARKLTTLFGTVTVDRIGYSGRGCESLHPLDATLNLPQERYSLTLRSRGCEAVAKGSFEQASLMLARATAAPVPKRQTEQLAQRGAQDFDAFYQVRHEQAQQAPASGSVLVLSVDGKGVVMRTEDLREPTKKAAQQRQHKLTKRLSKGEKRNCKRMSEVAAVYTVAPLVRTAHDIVKDLAPVRDTAVARPRPEHKRVWASLEKTTEQVLDEAMQEAKSRDHKGDKKWVALVDGNETQLRILRELADKYGVMLTIVIDIIHVLEYLWKASYVFNAEGSEQAQAWVTERLSQLLLGHSSHVAAGIRRSATLRNLADSERRAADDCADYLLKYGWNLRYDHYLAEGFPISTGVIEGACRYLVKDRMDITGARWSLAGAEAVLKLRSLFASGDFDQYWCFHEQREHERNHQQRYAGPIPPVPPAARRCGSHLQVVK